MSPKTVTTKDEKPARGSSSHGEDFSQELISQLNKERKDKIAFNLLTDDAPTNIKRWISTGSEQLDYIIANKAGGGLPEGRIIEISAEPGKGKSHLAYHAAKATQALGGIVVYIDTENATSLDNLRNLGVDVSKRFVFIQTACTEEVFQAAEAAILKTRAMSADIPVLVVWDSVAASSPKAELEGEYDQNSIGLNARVIGKGMRKIVGILGSEKVVFLIINQTRIKVGVMFGDPTTTPGGMAIPFASSVRIRLQGGTPLKTKTGDIFGNTVTAKTIKNKTEMPFRECQFNIIFGKGIEEHEQIFDAMRLRCDTEKDKMVHTDKWLLQVEGTGGWKYFRVMDAKTGEAVIPEVKFYKGDFGEKVLRVPAFKDYVRALMDATYVMKLGESSHPTHTGLDAGDEVIGQG